MAERYIFVVEHVVRTSLLSCLLVICLCLLWSNIGSIIAAGSPAAAAVPPHAVAFLLYFPPGSLSLLLEAKRVRLQ